MTIEISIGDIIKSRSKAANKTNLSVFIKHLLKAVQNNRKELVLNHCFTIVLNISMIYKRNFGEVLESAD